MGGDMTKANLLTVGGFKDQVGMQSPIDALNNYFQRAVPKPNSKPVDKFSSRKLNTVRPSLFSTWQWFLNKSKLVHEIGEFLSADSLEIF